MTNDPGRGEVIRMSVKPKSAPYGLQCARRFHINPNMGLLNNPPCVMVHSFCPLRKYRRLVHRAAEVQEMG